MVEEKSPAVQHTGRGLADGEMDLKTMFMLALPKDKCQDGLKAHAKPGDLSELRKEGGNHLAVKVRQVHVQASAQTA